MATQRVNFTKGVLERIAPPEVPETKRGKGGVYDTYYDTREKGLALIVSNGGGKTYYLYTKINGKPERIKLGAYADLSIEEARKKAAQYRGTIASGGNPQEDRRTFREETTFKELFDEYLERYSKQHKRSWRFDEREVKKFLPHWFNRKISTISTQEIQKLHVAIGKQNGTYQANRLLERIRAIYNKAIEWGWKGSNPAVGIRKFKEKSRDRFLQPHEMPYFFAALDVESNRAARDYILLSLLTGARKSNVLSMRWEEVNLEQAQWRIPETKNGDALIIPLSQQALSILQIRKAGASGPWVFPSPASRKGYLQEPKKAWQRLLRRAETYQLIDAVAKAEKWKPHRAENEKKASQSDPATYLQAYRNQATDLGLDTSPLGFPDIRIHDLRRSLGSWQAVTGASGYIIGKSLGHKSQQATAIYARLNLDPVRASVERATEAMLTAGGRASTEVNANDIA